MMCSSQVSSLTRVMHYLNINNDSSEKNSFVVLFDLSTNFDTVDHDILINKLRESVGLSDLNWFSFYLSDRTFCVSLSAFNSAETTESSQGFQRGQFLDLCLLICTCSHLATL